MNIPGTKQNEGPYDFMVKLLILGDSAVGKSALMCKFCDNNFSTSHIATIGVDFKYKTIECENKKIKMQIWDTAGQEKFRSIVQTYYKGAMGIILAYSVTDKKSFQNIEGWMKQIYNNAAADVIIILVGNKCDLPERVVEYSEGKRIADQYNIKFFETSAKDGINVNEAFYELGKAIKDKYGDDIPQQMMKPQEPGTNPGGPIKITDKPQPTPEQKGGCKC